MIGLSRPGILEPCWARKPPQPAKSKAKVAMAKPRHASRKAAPGTLDALWSSPAAMGIASLHAGSSRTDAILIDQSSDEEDFILLTPKPVVQAGVIDAPQKMQWTTQPRLPFETITMIGRFAPADTRAAVAATCGTLRLALQRVEAEGDADGVNHETSAVESTLMQGDVDEVVKLQCRSATATKGACRNGVGQSSGKGKEKAHSRADIYRKDADRDGSVAFPVQPQMADDPQRCFSSCSRSEVS